MLEEMNGSVLISLLWLVWFYWHVWDWLSKPSETDKQQTAQPDSVSAIVTTDQTVTAAIPAPRDALAASAPASGLSATLSEIERRDGSFMLAKFLEDAGEAYEAISTAFANGDRATLKYLLSPEVYSEFDTTITERETRGERTETAFIRRDAPELVCARICDNRAEMEVRFTSELFNVTRDKAGIVVAGYARSGEAVDIWAFARILSSSDPVWRLVATNLA